MAVGSSSGFSQEVIGVKKVNWNKFALILAVSTAYTVVIFIADMLYTPALRLQSMPPFWLFRLFIILLVTINIRDYLIRLFREPLLIEMEVKNEA